MPRVIHFDIAVDDTDRAIDCYSRAFGWTFTKAPGVLDYWQIKTCDCAGDPGSTAGPHAVMPTGSTPPCSST